MFELTATQTLWGRRAVLRATADPGSFAEVMRPYERGMEAGRAVRSQTATVRIELYRSTFSFWSWGRVETLEAEAVVPYAALEFGGDRLCVAAVAAARSLGGTAGSAAAA